MPLDRLWEDVRLLDEFLRVVLAEVALPSLECDHYIRRWLQLGHGEQAGRRARRLLRGLVNAGAHRVEATTHVGCALLGRAGDRAAERQEPVGQHEVGHEFEAGIVEHNVDAAVVHAAQGIPCVGELVSQHKLLLLLAMLGASGLQFLQVGIVQVGE